MTLGEAIKHAEEVAIEQDKLCKRYDDASGYTRSGNEAIRTSDAKKCEKCAIDHRQLAEWLKDYKRLLELQSCEDAVSRQAVFDIVDSYSKSQSNIEDVTQDIISDIMALPSVTPQLEKIRVANIYIDEEKFKEICKNATLTILDDSNTPTIQPNTGWWINDEDMTNWYDATYKCSCCGREIIIPYESRNDLYKNYPYCHCGAKMQEVEE